MFFFPFSKHDHVLTLPYLRKAMPYDRKSINEVKKLCTTHLPLLPPPPTRLPVRRPLGASAGAAWELQETRQPCRMVMLYTDLSSGWPNMSFCLLQQLKAKSISTHRHLAPSVWCP